MATSSLETREAEVVSVRPAGLSWLRAETLALAGAALLVAFLVLYPLGMLLYGSLRNAPPNAPGSFTLANYAALFTNASYHVAIGHTLLVALGTALVALVIGCLLAFIVARTNTPGRGLLTALILMPFVVSPYVSALAWVFLAAPRSGLLNQWLGPLLPGPMDIFTPWGIIWVMALSYVPYVFLFTLDPLRNVDPSYEEAARTAGGGLWYTVRTVTLPLIAPALLSSFLLVYVQAAGQFAVPGLLGMTRAYDVLSTSIFQLSTRLPANHSGAAALSSVLIALTVIGVYLQRRFLGKRQFTTITGKGHRADVINLGRWRFVTLGLALLYFVLAVFLPLLMIFLVSISKYWSGRINPDLFTFEHYAFVMGGLNRTQTAITNSLFLGIVGGLLCMLLAFLTAWIIHRVRTQGTGVLDFISTIPVGVPGLVFAIALLWAYVGFPVAVYGTIWILVISYVTHYLPYGVRTVGASLVQIHPELEESARVCGAGPLRRIRTVILPLLSGGFLAGWVFMFITFTRELSSAILLYNQRSVVLSVVMWDMWVEGTQPPVAALSLIQTLIVVLALVLFTRVLGGHLTNLMRGGTSGG